MNNYYQKSNPNTSTSNIEIFLNQILKPYESAIIFNPELKRIIEEFVEETQWWFDTTENRNKLESELRELITNFIIENRNNKIDMIL